MTNVFGCTGHCTNAENVIVDMKLEVNNGKQLKLISREAPCGEYGFVSKLSNREIKDAIKVLRRPPVYGVDENTRLASLHILGLELAARRSGLSYPRRPGASSES